MQDKIYIPPVRPSLELVFQAIKELAERNGGEPLKILEVGCGVKSTLHAFLTENNIPFILHGLDIDDYALENSLMDEVLIASAEKIPSPDNCYDIVFSLWVLEHIKDSTSALQEMSRVCRAGGMVAAVYPNSYSPEGVLTRLTPYEFHIWVRKHISKHKAAQRHTFGTYFSFGRTANVKKILLDSGMKNIEAHFFAELYYRFRAHYILGSIIVWYCRLISMLNISLFMSPVVIIAIK